MRLEPLLLLLLLPSPLRHVDWLGGCWSVGGVVLIVAVVAVVVVVVEMVEVNQVIVVAKTKNK